MSTEQVEEYAVRATRPATRDGGNEVVGAGLAAVAFALLEVAQAIREASERRDDRQ